MQSELIQLIFNDKRVRLVALLLLAFFLIWMLFSYSTHGQITVNTNNSNNVTSLIKIDNKTGARKTISFAQGLQFKASVSSGSYEISVANKSSSIAKYVVVKPPHGKTYELDIPAPVASRSVLPSGATNVAANNDQLFYLDYTTSNLYGLDASGIPTVINQDIHFKSIDWATVNFGVGQADNKQLYLIQDGVVSLLSVPFGYGSANVSYSVSPNNTVYISSGGTIYAGAGGQNFKKFFTVNSSEPLLFAGKSNLAIIAPAVASSGAAGPTDEEDRNVVVVSANGKQVASMKLSVSSLLWSPNGDKLAATNSKGGLTVYGASFVKIADVIDAADGVAWSDNNTLVYGQSVNLWKYDVTNGESVIVSSTPNKESVFNVFLSDDKSYVYFTGENQTDSSHILLRVGLTPAAQNVPSYYSALSVAFPQESAECNIGYSIFKNAYILISGWSDQAFCYSQAQIDLQNYGLPLSGFTITFTSTNSYNE